MRGGVLRGVFAVIVACLTLGTPGAAQAAVPDSLKSSCQRMDAADSDVANGVILPFWFCDDGVPDQGGTTANPGAAKAVPVPQRYGGDGFSALPPKAAAESGTGADANGDIALDVDLSLPDPDRHPPPRDGYPMVVLMHGCCAGDKTSWEATSIEAAGERWHYSNAWFAARGYVVVTYTSRGFVNGQNRGSTGQTQIDSRRYEINDFQHLAGQVADTSFAIAGKTVAADPRRVVATGGSYGGGFSWLALTDPSWTTPGGRAMRLAASAPKYGWTDLVYSLVPNGTHRRDALPTTDPAAAGQPVGLSKRSIVAGLYASGRTGVPPGTNHATFAPAVDQGITCLESPLPFSASPQCDAVLTQLLPEFLNDRSAYYQNQFFDRIRSDRSARVPVFSAATFTDPLFTPIEHRRMVERLKGTVPDYPLQEYVGDYQHFVQNKPREWGDLCGTDFHVCRLGDYPNRDLNSVPASLQRAGATARLNRFVDHHLRPPGNPNEQEPRREVTAGLQICPANAGGEFPPDQPGERFTESSFSELAPERLRLQTGGNQTVTNQAEPNPHSAGADPIVNSAANGGRCPVETVAPGPGVAAYEFAPLANDVVMIGQTRVSVPHTGSGGSELQLNARLYEVFADGQQVLVDRGVRVVESANGTTEFDLHGNGWRFAKGNRIRVELAQDDDPFVRSSFLPSTLTLQGVTLDIPVRPTGPDALIGVPELASDMHRNRSFPFALEPRSGELTGVDRGEVEVSPARGGGAARRLRLRRAALVQNGPFTRAQMGRAKRSAIRGRLGRTYRVRSRLFDRRGVAGDWSSSQLVVVPFDDRQRKVIRYGKGWRRVRSRAAYGKGFTRARRRGAGLRLRFRGDLLYLVGRRSRKGGRARVVLNGRRRVVRFRSRRTQNRRVVLKLRGRRRGVNRLRLVSLGGRVEIDAIGARRLR